MPHRAGFDEDIRTAFLGITLLAGAVFVGGYLYRRGLDRRRYRFIQ